MIQRKVPVKVLVQDPSDVVASTFVAYIELPVVRPYGFMARARVDASPETVGRALLGIGTENEEREA